MSLANRISGAWYAFMGRDSPTPPNNQNISYTSRTGNPFAQVTYNRGVIDPILNRISVDTASLTYKEIILDETKERYSKDAESSLNECLKFSANIDQSGRAFLQDLFYSCMDEGVVAAVPVVTDKDPLDNDSLKIYSIRIGKIVAWTQLYIQVELYDERDGQIKQHWFRKETTVILQNPFYEVMNKNGSLLKRLQHKMAILDKMDDQANSGKLDLIIQLPYIVKSKTRREQADNRKRELEEQLATSKYGIAYTDGTEKITQLNRPLDNNLAVQVEKLRAEFLSTLGLTQEVLDGTANEETMTNYYSRIIDVLATAFTEEATRKWLTPTARTQGHRIAVFRDYFKLMAPGKFADIADKLSRNEILTGNELRQTIGFQPSNDPNADILRNKNINASGPYEKEPYTEETYPESYDEYGNPIE